MNNRRDFLKMSGMLALSSTVPAPKGIFQEPAYNLGKTKIPVDDRWDVIVAGGGPAGCTAAIAAAREGARTLLIEATGALGGMGTSGLLNAWCPFTDGDKIIYKGLAEKILLASKKGTPHIPSGQYDWQPINTEYLKRVYDNMVLGSGASVLFFSQVAAVEMKHDDMVDAIIVSNKAGLTAYKAKVYVDCSGDGDLCAWAGADYSYGDEHGNVQQGTLCFSISSINEEAYRKNAGRMHGANKESPIHKILASGKYHAVDGHFNVKWSGPSFLMFNAGHVSVKSTEPEQLSKAITEGREIARQLHEGLKEFEPEIFSNSYLAGTGALMGIRESRRIKGDYIFTVDDWLERRSFEDEIGRNCYYIDIHSKDAKRYNRYGKGESHGIPYRILSPEKLRNVLMAGRCVSTDHSSLGSIRVMPVCLVTGEAAGLAAALTSQQQNINIHKIDVLLLRKRLREEGQYLL